jgi:hypothetical protein
MKLSRITAAATVASATKTRSTRIDLSENIAPSPTQAQDTQPKWVYN